jgi:hypothetical protein
MITFREFLVELARRGGTIENEQFFTKAAVASDVASIIKGQSWFKDLTAFIEPSAGGGALLKHFPGAKGYDLVPQGDDIEQADFLAHEFKTDPSKTLIFGNPPFGRGGSLALKFIRKAATLADTIAFILPRTFAKSSMKNRLPDDFHLVFEKNLPADSFESPSGAKLDVLCVFQIWRRGGTKRAQEIFDATNSPVKFVKPAEADYAVRKIGDDRSLGKIVTVDQAKPESSYFFIADAGDDLQNAIRKSSWDHIVGTAANGLKSISRLEFVTEVSKHL